MKETGGLDGGVLLVRDEHFPSAKSVQVCLTERMSVESVYCIVLVT